MNFVNLENVVGDNVYVHESAVIHQSSVIKGSRVFIGKNVEIHKDCRLVCAEKLYVGDNTVIKEGFWAFCRELVILEHNYILEGVWVEGSINSLETVCLIGARNLICQNVRINCNNKVEIGSNVVIGQNVEIWTHASAMDPIKGGPWVNKPVNIGSNLWLMANSTVLPGVKVGDNSQVGNYSFVNNDVPEGSFCAGIPVRVIKKNIYPKELSKDEKKALLDGIIQDYKKLASMKRFKPSLVYDCHTDLILFCVKNKAVFNLNNRVITGTNDEYIEDFRDYLRHRGIKFFTDKKFKSIVPKDFERWV